MPAISRITRSLVCAAVAAVLAVGASATGLTAQSAAQGGEVLTNASVIQMVTAKLQKSLVISKIASTPSTFDITADGLISLTLAKVPQDVIKAMMVANSTNAANRLPQVASEVLNNDAVVKMISGKVPKALVLDKIRETKGNYDVTTNGLVSLNQNKVPQDVIRAMMTAGGS